MKNRAVAPVPSSQAPAGMVIFPLRILVREYDTQEWASPELANLVRGRLKPILTGIFGGNMLVYVRRHPFVFRRSDVLKYRVQRVQADQTELVQIDTRIDGAMYSLWLAAPGNMPIMIFYLQICKLLEVPAEESAGPLVWFASQEAAHLAVAQDWLPQRVIRTIETRNDPNWKSNVHEGFTLAVLYARCSESDGTFTSEQFCRLFSLPISNGIWKHARNQHWFERFELTKDRYFVTEVGVKEMAKILMLWGVQFLEQIAD